jgi:hypothetical protein
MKKWGLAPAVQRRTLELGSRRRRLSPFFHCAISGSASGKIEDRLERIAVPETEAQAEPRESGVGIADVGGRGDGDAVRGVYVALGEQLSTDASPGKQMRPGLPAVAISIRTI